MKTLIWNKKENSIRGSFVNLMITLVILLLIVVGAFCDEVSDRMANMAALIIGFFTSTMGIWAYRKSKESCEGERNE